MCIRGIFQAIQLKSKVKTDIPMRINKNKQGNTDIPTDINKNKQINYKICQTTIQAIYFLTYRRKFVHCSLLI